HLHKARELLKQSLEFNIVTGARNNQLFVHAGVVGWRGKAIVIPGRSMTGKSNMVAALVNAGATYYSDEFAVFDEKGRVHPYPRTLRIRKDGASLAVEQPVRKIGKRPLPVGLVAALKYQRGAPWHPISLSPAETMFALLDNT